MKNLFTILLLVFTLPSLAGGSFLINEFQYDPDSSNGDANGDGESNFSDDEFVEIYNNTGIDTDISGWTLSDGSGVTHTFAGGSVVLADCSVVVFGGGTPTGFFGGSITQTASSGSLALGNSGDSLTLSDGMTDVATASFVDNESDNESLTRDPDITGVGFISHSGATGSGGILFSPGTQIDGSQFTGCPAAVDVAPTVVSFTPVEGDSFVDADTVISIEFDEDIDATVDAVTLTCDAMPVSFSGLPFSGSSLVITPDADLTFDANCTIDVLSAEVTDQDGTIDNLVSDYDSSFKVRPMVAPIIINEFQYDPDSTDGDANGDGTANSTQDEFVELYNNSGADLDISGYTISDEVLARHTFPENTVIPANCAIVVFGGGTPTGTFGDALVQTSSTNGFGFNNGGDSVVLKNGVSTYASYTYDGEGNNQAATLDPDITGLTYVGHSTATGSGGSLFSPGTRIDGTIFAGCAPVVDTAPSVISTIPVDAATDVLVDSTITINFDEAIDATASAVTVSCDAMPQTFTGLPFSGSSMVLTPDADLPNDAICTVDVLAAEVADQDGTVDNMAMDYSFEFTVVAADPVVIDILVNEYQADPDATNGDANGDGNVDTSEDEFIEIYNNSEDMVDLSGWTVSDAVGIRHTFDAGTMLDGCKSIVVFGGGTPTGVFGGSQTVVASEGFLGLNNGGDSIIINDGQVDQVNISTIGSSSSNQSFTLDPDITGLTFVEHSGATGSGGSLFSPGTQIDGTPFVPCSNTPTPPRVNSSIPGNGSAGVALDSDIEINFSENVNATINAATLSCGGNSIGFTGLPLADVSQLIIDPLTDLPNGETCTVELIATAITDLDDMPDELDGNGDGTAGDNYTLAFIAGFPEVEIHEIQGSGLVSPYSGITVSTMNNIVTALGTSGFYMQAPDANADADSSTSEGIFVYTQTPPTVQVGDEVNLTGEITEFFGLTEFTNPNDYILSVVSSGNLIPTPIILDDSFPSQVPDVFPCGDESLGYECFEGMYFEMPQGFISAASVATFFAGSDEDDVYVRAGSSRAFREPGIEFPGLPGLPVFDGNPELIEMSVDALALPFQPLSAGSEIALKGVISFGFNDYELQPSELTVINENILPGQVRDASIDEFTIASANIQRFFDPIDDVGPEDDDQIADPVVYANRLLKLADYVVNDLKSPTIIALQEIENLNVLTDLIAAVATAGGPDYSIELFDGNDQGGIDVAYMYQTNALSNVDVTQLGASELNSFDGSLLHDRPPLYLTADVAVGSESVTINVIVVHMRSRGGIDDNSDGERVRSKRLQQANSVAAMAVDILSVDANTPLFVVGDFNAFQFSDGYVDVVGQITGEAVAADNLVWTKPMLADSPLTQAVQTLAAEQQYSFVFRGSAQILDNALMNDAALMITNEIQFARGQADAYINFEDDSSSLRSTDHDGFVLFIQGNDDLIFMNGFE